MLARGYIQAATDATAMTLVDSLGLFFALSLMGVGLIGCLLPGVPGTPLVMIAALAHRLVFGERSIGWGLLCLLAVIMVIAMALDYLASIIGARKMGATWRGITGATLGILIGVFFSIPGMILGPFLGAFTFEWFGCRDSRRAGKAGLGALIGMLVGGVGKFACAVAMTLIFLVGVLSRFWA